MKQTKRFLALGMAACLLLLGACGKNGAGDSSEEEELKATAVEVQTVAQGEMAASNTLAGQVTPVESIQVFPMLAGQVQTLNAAEGQVVGQGDTLFTIDTSTVTSTLSALQQSYNATKTATDQAISSAQIGVQNAELAVTQAQTALDNTNALFEVGAASSQQVTQAEQAVQQAQAALQQAQASVQQAQASQQSSLAQIQASIDQIQAQAALGTVTAPVSGKITDVNITLGGMAAQSTPAVVIAKDSALMVSVFASENVRGGLQVGDVADVTIESISTEPMQCAIRTVAETADAQTNLYEITLYLPEGIDPPIGAFADVTLYTDRRDSAIQIPTESILTDGEEQYVFVVNNGVAAKVTIQTGLVGDGVTEITGGLTGGESLVVKGQSYLSDGAVVRVVDGEE